MSTSIVWKVVDLQRRLSDGYVFKAKYTVDASDDTYSFGGTGEMNFEEPEELKPFSELTEEEVIGWIKESLGEEKLENLTQQLIGAVAEQRTPTIGQGTPW